MIKKYWWDIGSFILGAFTGFFGGYGSILAAILGMIWVTIGYESGYLGKYDDNRED